MDAEGADHVGVGVGQGADGGPIGFGGGIDVEESEPGGAGAGEDLRQMTRQARILQVVVRIDPSENFRVRGRRGVVCSRLTW